MIFSCILRSFPARARALNSPAFMDRRKSFTLNPSLLASSGSLHSNHRLPSSTLIRFFSAETTSKERGSELLKNKETTFGNGKGEKYDPSNQGGHKSEHSSDELLYWLGWITMLLYFDAVLPKSAYEAGVEKKNKERFEEFKLKLLEPGFVSKIVVVDHSLAVVYLKDNTEDGRLFKSERPIEKGVYLLDIKSPESFKVELEQTQKILRLDPFDYVPVIDLTKCPKYQKKQSATARATTYWNSPRGSSFPE